MAARTLCTAEPGSERGSLSSLRLFPAFGTGQVPTPWPWTHPSPPPPPSECRPQRPQLAVSTAERAQHQAGLLPLPLPCEWVARVTFERSLTLNEASAGLCFIILPEDRACFVTWLGSCLCRPLPHGIACAPGHPACLWLDSLDEGTSSYTFIHRP